MNSYSNERFELVNSFDLGDYIQSASLRIDKTQPICRFDVQPGTHTAESEVFQVGTAFGTAIWATIVFHYSYSVDENKLTIFAAPHESLKTELRFFVAESWRSPAIRRAVSLSNIAAFESSSAEESGSALRLLATHKDALRLIDSALTKFIDGLIDVALQSGIASVLRTAAPPTITRENVHHYASFFDEETERSQGSIDNQIAVVQEFLNSTVDGVIAWRSNFAFANVVYSTDDPKPSGVKSWIELWSTLCNGSVRPAHCTSFNYSRIDPDWVCDFAMKGGHVVPGTVAKAMKPGSAVYIFPICHRHNASDANTMKVVENFKGVQLTYWDTE
jgi:hypothetical protein